MSEHDINDKEPIRRICQMEHILDEAIAKMDEIGNRIEEFMAFQTEIQKLEAYYTGTQWKADREMDEAGIFPEDLKRGVLSEDGVWNMLERNRELLEMIRSNEWILN